MRGLTDPQADGPTTSSFQTTNLGPMYVIKLTDTLKQRQRLARFRVKGGGDTIHPTLLVSAMLFSRTGRTTCITFLQASREAEATARSILQPAHRCLLLDSVRNLRQSAMGWAKLLYH